MSFSRLSAGAGYRYLLRHTAVGDAPALPGRSLPGQALPGQSLTAYYTATGLPPGRWVGAGLPGLGTGDGTDLQAGAVVTEEAMGRLFGTGHNPVTGERLGLAYPRFKTAAERTAERVARLPADLPDPDRTAAVTEIEAQEAARPVRSAVAGYDLTFTAPKSVSVLWALGDPDLAYAIEQAHHDALDAVLQVVEERFLHTRIGDGSKIRVPARGAIAAAFDHWDTRAGDPNLHTHLVIANKVQGPDRRWRAVDGQVLYAAAVACSEIYDTTLADLLHARLGASFGYRDRGPRRTPAFEIEGIPEALLAAFSSRSHAITAHTRELVAAFSDAHGREPDRTEVLRLRQRATLATRPDKHLTPLPELRARWRATAETVTGTPVDTMLDTAIAGPIARALTSTNNWRASGRTSDPIARTTAWARIRATRVGDHPDVDRRGVDRNAEQSDVELPNVELPASALTRFAEQTLTGVATRRATWTATNLLAEAARATRALRLPDPQSRMVLLDRVVASALERCVALDPPLVATTAQRYRHPPAAVSGTAADPVADGAAVRTVAGTEAVFTTWEVLAAEARLLGAHADTTAPVGHPEAFAIAARPMPGWMSPSPDQVYAAGAILGSGRRVDVLVGPAGAGKTATLHVVRGSWELTYGPGSVIGLAPSATAAAQLALALRIPADTVAKWLHESAPATPATTAATATTGTDTVGRSWRFRAGQLVLIDEAAMVATADLDQIVTHASAAGAKVVLVGDYAQLGAIDAGGAFALLAGEGHALELDQLHRFSQDWEATATRQLRIGDPACLDTYTAQGRLHDGPAEAMIEAAYRAWNADLAAGQHSLLLAADRATVSALNQRARVDRIRDGLVDRTVEVTLNDGTTASVGDLVLSRRNQRSLTRPDGGHVRNGDRWQVMAVLSDGALDVAPASSNSPDGLSRDTRVRLPADYVRDHVELGYAFTVHRAQGATADTTHLVTDARMSREALYVGLTRGRHANHAYVTTDIPETEVHASGHDPTGRRLLEAILRSSAAESSATAILRQREADHILALSRAGRWPPERADDAHELGWSHTAPERQPPAYGISR